MRSITIVGITWSEKRGGMAKWDQFVRSLLNKKMSDGGTLKKAA